MENRNQVKGPLTLARPVILVMGVVISGQHNSGLVAIQFGSANKIIM